MGRHVPFGVMGWFAGYLGPDAERIAWARLLPGAKELLDGAALSIRSAGATLLAGGAPAALRFGQTADSGVKADAASWLVLGTGFERSGASARMLQQADWRRRLASASVRLDDLEGHFVALRLDGSSLRCWNDAMGVRTLYAARSGSGLFFASRVDWVARLTGESELDAAACAARWNLHGERPDESLVHGIRRLGPGGTALLLASEMTFNAEPWFSESAPPHPADPVGELSVWAGADLGEPTSRILALSGGLDSRLLLALMMERSTPPARIVVFGAEDHPDARVSRRIASDMGLAWNTFDDELPAADALLTQVAGFCAETTAWAPASEFLQHRNIHHLAGGPAVFVDGSGGDRMSRIRTEWRYASLFHRVTGTPLRAVRDGQVAALAPHFLRQGLPFLAPELRCVFHQEGLQRIGELLASGPYPARESPHRWYDWVRFSMHRPMILGSSLPYMERHTATCFPFGLRAVAQAILRTPVGDRTDGRLFKAAIARLAPALADYPLVKGRNPTAYPFSWPLALSGIYLMGRRLLHLSAPDRSRQVFIRRLREPLLALLHDRDVRGCGLYDPEVLDSYDLALRSEADADLSGLDRWISFEAWRGSAGVGDIRAESS